LLINKAGGSTVVYKMLIDVYKKEEA
jgi:hypothetical protein